MSMGSQAFDLFAFKVMASVTAAGTIFGGFFLEGGNLPFFNVSISTLGMSAAGSMIAFAYGTPVDSRKKLYGYAIGGTFIGVWAVQILPSWMSWGWYVDEKMAPPIAGIVALLSRWIVPFIIEQGPVIFKRIFNVGGQNPGGKP